jgi:pimeloyl-ACP methyl ester carboxylesterase
MALAGIVDLRTAHELGIEAVDRLMGGDPAQVGYRFDQGDPAALIPLGVQQVLLHGTADSVVPESLSAGYVRAAKSRGDAVQLVALPGIGHFEPIDPTSGAWASVRESLYPLVT